MAKKPKTVETSKIETEFIDRDDKDKDPSGSSGHSSETEESKDFSGSPFDSNYISMDLPGGICSWKDHSSFLSLETPTDSLTVLSDHALQLDDIREDILTTSPLEPVAPSQPSQEPAGEEGPRRTAKDELSNDIESLLEEVRNIQTRLSDLPDESLQAMEDGLREGITVLVKCEEAADLLETKIMEYRQEAEVQALMKDLIIMKARISKLLTQARQGLDIIQDAKAEVERQTKEIEEHKEKITKLDKWLENINGELKESTKQADVVNEDDIIRYIEIYERYIREYDEYEIILKSITVISQDESSQSLREKLSAMQKALADTKSLVIIEIERLRQVLLHMRSLPEPELIEDDISQTDRTIDSTSMPEEVVTPKEIIKEVKVQEIPTDKSPIIEENKPVVEKVDVKDVEIQEVKPTATIDTQTGKSLILSTPSVSDKSVICQPDIKTTHDVSITCAPPQEIEVQTSEPHSEEKEVLESIQIRQTISDGHETIEIASRPVVREQKLDEQSLLVNANYQDSNILKDSQLNIIHSLPQSFETVMTEPDETTTEVVVDADGTKRIIVRKVRKTLVTRQQTVQTQQQRSQILSSENIPQDQSFSQITLQEDKGETSTTLDDGGVQHIQYQTYGGQILSGLPGREMTIQEFTSKPDMIIRMEHGMKPEEILQLTEGEIEPQIQTSSSSVTAVVQQVTKRIIKTKRRIIRRVVIIDGKEHVTEEVIEEPDNVEVFEEQIPRVSISVKDQSGVQFEDIDDSKGDGKDDQSPALPPDSAKDTGSRESKPTDDNRKSPKDSQKSTEKPLDYFSPTETQALQGMLKEFMEKESQYSPQSQPVTVTADDCEKTPVQTSFETVFVDEPQVYEQTYRIQEPQDGQTILLTGGAQYSTVESSSNVATVVQKITRKITRTRKRIIKHIQIIDGKEHVTEEVIEEPDDVEIIEEEPIMSHNIQTHGIKTKRVKIIRQVQIIDGKEHVTEQVIEEPDDEYIPETTVTAEIDVNINKPVTILKNNDEKVDQINVNKDTPVTDLTVKESRAKTSPIVTDEATDTALTTSSKALLTNIVATIPDSSEKYNTSLVDVTKAFLGSETDHSTILGSPTVETIKQTTSDNNILITAEPSTVIETTLPITVTSEMVQETNTLIPETVTIPTITEATSIKFEDKTVPLSEEITAEKVPSEIVTLTDTSKDISMKPPAFAVSTVPITDVTQSPQELLQKEQSQTILIHETITTPEIETDETILHKNPEDKGISTVESILETSLRVTKESPKTEQYKISQTQAETSPILSSVEVEPLKIGTIISETDVKNVPGLSELSYIQQFDSKTTGSTESVDKVVIPIHPQTSFDTNVMPTDFVEIETSGSNKEDTKYDINTLLEAERQDTYLRGFSDKPNPGETDVSQETTSATENRLQTVDMSMSLVKTQQLNETKPEVQFDIKVEGFEAEPIVVKKDVTVILPLDVKITEEHIQTPAVDLVKKEHPVISEIIPDESIKEHKRSKKRKKNKRGSEDSDSISIEIPVEIEKVKTDSSVVTTKVTENPLQTVDISMSLTKTHEIKEIKPEVQFDIKVEGFESGSTVVKKDIIVNLPLDIKITEEHIQTPTENLVELEQPVISEAVTIEPIKEQKVSKKKKKNKRGSEDSDSITTEIPVETDKSVTESESTSLSHYVELPTSPPIESPKPTQEILEPIIETSRTELQPESPIIESESVTEEIGYEPEDVSMGPIVTPDKKKKQKKRKQHGVSEETTYPKLSTTDSDETSLTSPKETAEPSTQKKSKDKKRKKKTKSGTSIDSDLDIDNKPEEKLESPKVGSEILETSPKQESYHTMSEASDNATVKIIEECVQSSPETLQKEVTTTITYPVPVVEEITTQEYSIQTSPEVSLEQRKEEIERPETVDIVQQTSPTPLSESLVQTTPVEDKEAHTQTIEDITVVEKVPISDSEIQTSRTETPELLQSEVTTQVIAYDICAPEEKFSQTSSPIEETKLEEKVEDIPPITTECREIQTSPLPLVQKDEKSTEIIIETSDTDIQTIKKEIIDQETSTSPVKDKDLTEMSMQTPEIPLVSSFTQSDEPMPEELKVEEKLTVITTESAQQTSPTESPEESLKLELTKPEVIDSTQQTSPRIEEIEQPREMEPFEITKTEVITIDNTQQTSPREEVAEKPQEPEVIPIKTEVVTIDTTQQTSPREVVAKAISPDLELIRTEIITVDNTQQTSPREDEPKTPESESVKANVLTVDSVQQTTPRNEITPSAPRPSLPELELVKNEVLTIDATQQTTPRGYSEDSISTSTDEPYEVHLRAQISIPQTTDDFIANERNEQEKSQSIVGEKHKQKKKKHKKKTESPTIHSPESLSDPITTELSMSVTPTSDDLSSKDPSSIDEGISQMVSPVVPKRYENNIPHQSKLTYSDVVQRSKSKSPSPSKITAQKSEKARLLDALEKRTQSVSAPPKPVTDNSMALVLYEPGVEKSYDLIVNKEIDEVREAAENNDTSRVERSVIVVIETISIWLEEIQYKIQRETASGIIEVDENERLTSIQSYIRKLKEIIEITEINEEITTLIETLTQQVNAVNTLNEQSSTKVQENEYEWNKFLDETEKLKQSVNQVKSKLDDIILSDISSQQKLDKLDKIELNNSDNSDNVKKLFRKFKVLAESNPKQECPENLYISDDDIKHIENVINTERDRLLQLTSLVEEYEQTLQDFGQITDVAEALLDGKIIVSNLDHLHEEIQKHRKFFVNLSHCRAILESLEDNLDSETKSKYSSLHNSLHDRATLIIDRAASRAQQMTLAASKWTTLEQGMKAEKQWLVVAQQRVPDLTNVTSMDHEQYINLYQSLTLDVSHHYAKMLRLLSITESLQNLIICSGLETECSVALDTLLKLQEDVDSKLTRLTAFKENWLMYDHLIDRIEGWIRLANRELEIITPENISTSGHLRRFWELKAQHEVHNNLKNESGIQFEKALEILPISDEMVQRQFFSKIEDKWRDLAAKIDVIHVTAIQNISDRDVTSGEKLNILEEEIRELRASLDGLKGVIKSEDELNLYIERLQVMTGRMDRIQNELGRLSLLPTAESERLGALLTQSGILDDLISEELERSLLLKEKIVQVQAGILRCQKSQRRARLTLEECESAERLGSDVVERASENCERLLEDLASQWRDILALRQALHTLPTSLRVCVSPTGVERDISALQETHAELEAACNELSARLRAKVQLWRRFERQLELVQGAVREADYMVELLTVQGQVDYDRLLKATEKLETLSESLSRRSGELVGELKDAAAPLEASTEPSVAAQLRRELDDAAAAYEHTCSNLTQLCDKYHKAVELWKRYRDAAAAVRTFAEFMEGRLHSLRPDDAPATAQACLEQESRVAELRSLAARVAAETGSRALQTDADALARRLQLVAGAVQVLADLGEARQLARAKALQAKEKLCDMRQDLAPLHEDGEIVEDKLIALRDNLIALGKSEADIAPGKAELPEIDRDISDEHSIVRILELWQAMFRDTFLHYHRLSTALVRSGDAATALKLWHEYLLDLQSFLSGSVPADYENLTEHRRLCRVHRNLLTSQRSVLMNENRDLRNRELSDRFDMMTNLHNETLSRIVERHDEVCTRIAAWDDYREINTELLRWLKQMEREKEKLQLRYVHMKTIHKILAKIQNLSDKVPEGRKQSEKLLTNLKKVLEFTEETYGASVRIEYAGVVKRVDNLQASLDTWRDFLSRILALIGEYETLTNDLNKLFSKTQNEINSYSDEQRLSRPQLKKAIDKYTELRKKIEKTETQLEALSVIQEQLKECLSPQDIRIVNQRIWQLRQQRADLEHQLSIIIYRLQERLEVYTLFDSRLTRFAEWITTLESKLEISSQNGEVGALDPQDLIRRINSDVQAETSLKEREFEWLVETGNALIDLSKKDEKSYSKNTSKQLKDVQERWQKLQETGRSRIAKINELLETISQLEERLTEIRLKLHTIESQLSTTVVLEHLTSKAVDEKFKDRDDIQKNIESESSEVGETLNYCQLIFNDPDIVKGNFDLRNLKTGVDIVEKKWKNICDMSEHRKNALKEIRKSAELANSLLPKVEKKLDSIEKRVEKIETRKQRGESEDESVTESVLKDLEALESDIKKLEDAYSRVASTRGIELRGAGADDAARLRGAVRRWQQLRVRVDAAGADAHRQFVAAHGKAVVTLAEADVRLTRALHLAPTPQDKAATLQELDGVEEELRECEALVEDADRLSAAVSTVSGVPDMVAEYRALYADVKTRLDLARAEVLGDVAIQVDTLTWETDVALQVDTLTSKETYRVELASAVREASDALEALRTALLQQPKENASGDELATAAKEIAKAGAKPGQTLELAKHLSELLLTECDATEDEALLKEVESLSMRYEDLLAQAKKRELQINNLRLPHSASYALTCEHEAGRLTCPLCSERNWKQLDNDLWRLEQWLQFAEATQAARTDPPEQYDALEDAIQDHREFLLDLDSHKSIVVSLNVVGSHVAQHAESPARADKVRARLAAANARWDAACEHAGVWQKRLQRALVHNQQFHDIVVELVARLASAERGVRSREPLRLTRPAEELQRDFRRFSELRDELSRAEPRVLALHESAQLLRAGDAPAHADDICRRLGELRLRLQSLRKLSGVYALKLGAALARQPARASALAAIASAAAPQLMEEEEGQISTSNLPPLDENDVVLTDETEDQELSRLQRGLRFVCRVAKASIPFQALLLLLLGAAALAPHAHSDCRSSGLALEPVLRYPEGPPPL